MTETICANVGGETTAAQPPEKKRHRIDMFDALRFTGAIGIIWQHSANAPASFQWRIFGTWGVSFFAAAAVYFLFEGLRRDSSRTFARYAVARVRRIYVPFIIWSLLYYLLRYAKHLIVEPQAVPKITANLFVSGTAHHLWFLPFLLLVSICTFPIAKWTIAARWRCIVVAVIGIVLGVWVVHCPPMPTLIRPDNQQTARVALPEATLAPAPANAAVAYPNWVWQIANSPFGYLADRTWATLPAVLWGIALGALAGVCGKLMRSQSALGFAAGLLFVVTLGLEFRDIITPRLAENFAGFACVVIGLMPWTGRFIRALAGQGFAAYAIYLVHIAFLEAIMTVLLKAFHMPESLHVDVILFIFSAIVSVIAGRLIAKSRVAPWLAPS